MSKLLKKFYHLVILVFIAISLSCNSPIVPTEPTDTKNASTPTSTPIPITREGDGEDTMEEDEDTVDLKTTTDYTVSAGSKAQFLIIEQLRFVSGDVLVDISTDDVSGDVFIDGKKSSTITLNIHGLTSDESNRDAYIRRQLYPDHPEAVISIPAIKDIPDYFFKGELYEFNVNAELMIKGVIKNLDFGVEAKKDGDNINLLATSILTWEDIALTSSDILAANPVVGVDDEFEVRILLILAP